MVGDLRGHFNDLLELFNVGGDLPESNYLFLGGYVNRGIRSIETIQLLLALKLRYPDRVTLLRGNNESKYLSELYGLYDECLFKYGTVNVWKYLTVVFD